MGNTACNRTIYSLTLYLKIKNDVLRVGLNKWRAKDLGSKSRTGLLG